MNKILKGDEVLVISGKDKGKKAKVLQVYPKLLKALVDGVNVMKRHTKPNQSTQGGILDRPTPILMSKLMLVDPKSGKASRVSFKIDKKTSKKTRVAVKSGQELQNNSKARK